MRVTVTSETPVDDQQNPDPGTIWIVSWVRADDENAPHLQQSTSTMTPIDEMIIMYPGTTWLARDVIVEEGVYGQPNLFRIRHNNARKLA